MANHHSLEIILHSSENSCEVRSLRRLLSLSASLLLSACLSSLFGSHGCCRGDVQTFKGQSFPLILQSSDLLATDVAKVAAREHQHSEDVGEAGKDMTFGVVCGTYMHVPCTVCVCVVFECVRLLGLSSVRALKVGPDFTVISHPNGSCHILLPMHGWSTTKSQDEKRKLNGRSICLSTLPQNKKCQSTVSGKKKKNTEKTMK